MNTISTNQTAVLKLHVANQKARMKKWRSCGVRGDQHQNKNSAVLLQSSLSVFLLLFQCRGLHGAITENYCYGALERRFRSLVSSTVLLRKSSKKYQKLRKIPAALLEHA